MPSSQRTAFEAAAFKKDWKVAYNNFRILSMSEMCKGLHALGKFTREAFWNERHDNLNFQVELERWEYAYTVVRFHTLPANPPNSGQEQEAKDFLKGILKKPVSTIEKNLGYSMQAVNYTLTKNNIKGANWDFYTPATKSNSYEYYARKAAAETDPKEKAKLQALADSHKNATDICVYDKTRPDSDAEFATQAKTKAMTVLDEYRIIAANAKKNGCGNCGENSIVAFMFLYDMGVRPIERVAAFEDHAFVIIGRANVKINDYANWGPHAVLCDPWAQGFRSGQPGSGTYSGARYVEVMGTLLSSVKIRPDFYRAS
ncbi:hypothetical protein ETAA8_09900 [Anatilimnocola aggregata]|uniref:Uncharacterized protein n=1 Tax=Anatilimnocola aggregata TaxID=2528021 RepID=A0A517Y6Q3_9BACT|nr:hypothetical protein [Anatilimnocola aggregata]QDU25918.1 hypothetical protein ETAA8_09900 [Anatilimnocola aggregata]